MDIKLFEKEVGEHIKDIRYELQMYTLTVLNKGFLSKDLLEKHMEFIEETIPEVDNQTNLLYIYTFLLSENNLNSLQKVRDRLETVFDFHVDYHNYDLAYIYAKNEKLDLNQFSLTEDHRQDRQYDIYFTKGLDKEEVFIDLKQLNLTLKDYVDYFVHKQSTSSSMKSDMDNNEAVKRLIDINTRSFKELTEHFLRKKMFFPARNLKVEVIDNKLEVVIEKEPGKYDFNPFDNGWTLEENLSFINRVFEKSHQENQFLLYFALKNISKFAELNGYDNIKRAIFRTFAEESEKFFDHKDTMKIFIENNLDYNFTKISFMNIILVEDLMDEDFLGDFFAFIKNCTKQREKQKLFISLQYIPDLDIKLEDFFEKEFLDLYSFSVKYGTVQNSGYGYDELMYNRFFKSLYSDYFLSQRNIPKIIEFVSVLDSGKLVDFVKENPDSTKELQVLFFHTLHNSGVYTDEEYNKMAVRNLFKNFEYTEDDIEILKHSSDKTAILDKLSTTKKAMALYLTKDKEAVSFFENNKKFLLSNKDFVEMLIEQENKEFIREHMRAHRNASIVLDISEKAKSHGLDLGDMKEEYSTMLVEDINDVF